MNAAVKQASMRRAPRALSLPVVEAVHDLAAALRELQDSERAVRTATTPARAEDARRACARSQRGESLARERLYSLLRESV